MTTDSTPADYVRVEIRRGDVTTTYELAGDPRWPVEVTERIETPVQDVQVGVMVRRVPGVTTVNLALSGRMATGERVTKPAAEKPPMQVKLYTHLLPVSLVLHMANLPAEMQESLRPHITHQTQAEESILGWRRVHCLTCDRDVWSV
ncbi:hypothetical protein [Plantactinospora sp. WMMB782]|uniref:hypothetical protein n=1 Tax=Plantactinospora sp. WMMB782 TaxID=3404121 RepID=UPI003B926B25